MTEKPEMDGIDSFAYSPIDNTVLLVNVPSNNSLELTWPAYDWRLRDTDLGLARWESASTNEPHAQAWFDVGSHNGEKSLVLQLISF